MIELIILAIFILVVVLGPVILAPPFIVWSRSKKKYPDIAAIKSLFVFVRRQYESAISGDGLLFLIPAAMSLIALAHMAYGYYQLLGLVVTGSAAYLAWRGLGRGERVFPALFALVALTFNPVFKVHFEREQWATVNIIVAGLYLVALVQDRRRNRPS